MDIAMAKKKRNACGIVVEYNPLHTGHRYHIQQSRATSQCDVLIAVMSPYFVQRGDIAILSPYERAEEAIKQGVDLVVELPYPYCTQHADKFALGAIKVLKQLHIDSLCFGSESNDLMQLQEQVTQMEKNACSSKLFDQSTNKKVGTSLAATNQNDFSNDILGIAYLKALKNTDIAPLTIQRTNSYRSENITSQHASASALRRSFYETEDERSITPYTPLYKAMKANHLPSLKEHYPILRYLLTTLSSSYLKTIFLMDEGIEGLLTKQAMQHSDFDSFVSSCTSKRYTKSRITRTLCHLLLQTTKERANQLEELTFVRVLAMNGNGRQYLKEWKAAQKIIQDEHNKQPSLATVPDSIQIVSRFNQLPALYQEETMRHIRVVHQSTDKKRLEAAVRQELSYPILVEEASYE